MAVVILGAGLISPRLDVLPRSSYESSPYALAMDRMPQNPNGSGPQIMRAQLEGQFVGPLQDTLIQRWRDPIDGTVCYIYLPVAVAHAAGPSGLVQYGSANIGSISCLPPQGAK